MADRPSYILGVDGGNSKTLAALADQTGTILGVGRAGCSNHQGIGLAPAMEQIRCAAEQALGFGVAGARSAAVVGPAEVEVAYFCLAGADLPEDFELLRPALQGLRLARRVGLSNDTIAALRSGTDEPSAVVVVLGAGINAAGRNAAGKEIRLSGLGWISGDWGGGGEIGQEAIRLSVRAWDGRGEPTALQAMVLQAFEVPDVESLIRKLYRARTLKPDESERARTFDLVPLVFRAAELGDAVAVELVRRVAGEVVITASALLRRLELLDTPADLVLAGSVFRAEGPLLIDTIRMRLSEIAPLARIVVPELEPVLGALLCGMDLAEIDVNEQVHQRVAASCKGGS